MKTKITNYCLKCGGKMKLQGGGNGFNTASNLMNTAGDIANMFPGVGTAIGAGLKGLSFVSDMFAKRQAVKDNQNLIAKNDRNIPIYQSNESVYPNPNQNMMQTGGVPTQGGVIQPVSSTGSVALGQTHDEGGIKYAPNIEVENKEGIHNVDDKTVVSSNVLKNPLTGKSFASEMVGLEKQKGDLEIDLKKELDKSKGKSTYTSIMLKKRIDELEVKIGELYEQQEALASKMGLRDEQGNPNQMSQQVVGNEEQIQNMQQQVMKQQAGGNIKRIDPINGKEYFLNKDNKMVDSDGNIKGDYKVDINNPELEYGISNSYNKVDKYGKYINTIDGNSKVNSPLTTTNNGDNNSTKALNFTSTDNSQSNTIPVNVDKLEPKKPNSNFYNKNLYNYSIPIKSNNNSEIFKIEPKKIDKVTSKYNIGVKELSKKNTNTSVDVKPNDTPLNSASKDDNQTKNLPINVDRIALKNSTEVKESYSENNNKLIDFKERNKTLNIEELNRNLYKYKDAYVKPYILEYDLPYHSKTVLHPSPAYPLTTSIPFDKLKYLDRNVKNEKDKITMKEYDEESKYSHLANVKRRLKGLNDINTHISEGDPEILKRMNKDEKKINKVTLPLFSKSNNIESSNINSLVTNIDKGNTDNNNNNNNNNNIGALKSVSISMKNDRKSNNKFDVSKIDPIKTNLINQNNNNIIPVQSSYQNIGLINNAKKTTSLTKLNNSNKIDYNANSKSNGIEQENISTVQKDNASKKSDVINEQLNTVEKQPVSNPNNPSIEGFSMYMYGDRTLSLKEKLEKRVKTEREIKALELEKKIKENGKSTFDMKNYLINRRRASLPRWYKQSEEYKKYGSKVVDIYNPIMISYYLEDLLTQNDLDLKKIIESKMLGDKETENLIKLLKEYSVEEIIENHLLNSFQTGGKIQDNNGYLKSNLHNYTPVKLINSNHITTKNMAFPIEANGKVLYPNTGDYYFKKKPVVEKPLNFKSGGTTKIGTDFNDIDALNSEFHKYNIPLKIENKNTIYVNNERKYFPNGIDDNIIKELLTPFNSTNLIEDYQSGGDTDLYKNETIVNPFYQKDRTSKYELGKTEFKQDKKSTKSPFRGEELFSYGTQIAGSLLPMVMPLKKTELNYYDEGKGYGYLNNAYRSALLYPKKMEELSNYNLNRDLAQYSQALTNNGSNMNRTPMLQNLYAEGRSKANDLIANSQAKSLELQTALAESIYNKDRSKYLTNQEINAQNDNFANNYLATKYINPLSKLSESTVQQLEAKRNYIEETTKNNKIAGYELVYNPETGRHEYIRINSNAKGLTNTPSNKLQSIPVPNLKLETPDYKLNK